MMWLYYNNKRNNKIPNVAEHGWEPTQSVYQVL